MQKLSLKCFNNVFFFYKNKKASHQVSTYNHLVLIPLISMIVKIIQIFLSVLGRVAVSTSYLVIFFSPSLNFPMSTVTSRIYCYVKINPQCNWRRQPAVASQLCSLKFSWIAAFSVESYSTLSFAEDWCCLPLSTRMAFAYLDLKYVLDSLVCSFGLIAHWHSHAIAVSCMEILKNTVISIRKQKAAPIQLLCSAKNLILLGLNHLEL